MIYRSLKMVRWFLMHSPLWLCEAIGVSLGYILYLNAKKRKVAFKNIKLAFADKKNRQLKKILRRSFKNFGLGLIESFITTRLFERIDLSGKEKLPCKGGNILVGIHFGSWELYNAFFASEVPLAVLAKKQKNPGIDKFLDETRGKTEFTFSLKSIIQYIKKDWNVGLVVDHGAEENAAFVELFSQIVPAPQGAVFLAKKFNRQIFPCYGYRLKRFSHKVIVGDPINTSGKTEKEVLQEMNKFYEGIITSYPDNYLWSYKRFKRKKTLDVIILNDGRIGHLKQSQALLKYIEEEDFIVRSKTIDISYKHKSFRNLADIFAFFCGKIYTDCTGALKLLLKKESYQQVMRHYADIVISTGSVAAPTNKILSSYLGARSVAILRPNIPVKKFDLAIIPEHDRLPPNFGVTIKGALVYPQNTRSSVDEVKNIFSLSDRKKVSFFIGGAKNSSMEFISNLKMFIKHLKPFCINNNYGLLVSTSRRTPLGAEKFIKDELDDFEMTEAIVIANQKNYPCVFEGFVGSSEIVFVSSESISMISEVMSLGIKCVPIQLEPGPEKHNVFLQSIENQAPLLRNPFNVDRIKPKQPTLAAENRKKIKNAIKTVL